MKGLMITIFLSLAVTDLRAESMDATQDCIKDLDGFTRDSKHTIAQLKAAVENKCFPAVEIMAGHIPPANEEREFVKEYLESLGDPRKLGKLKRSDFRGKFVDLYTEHFNCNFASTEDSCEIRKLLDKFSVEKPKTLAEVPCYKMDTRDIDNNRCKSPEELSQVACEMLEQQVGAESGIRQEQAIAKKVGAFNASRVYDNYVISEGTKVLLKDIRSFYKAKTGKRLNLATCKK